MKNLSAMHLSQKNKMQTILLKNKEQLIIREATKEDAPAAIDYIKRVGDETDFLTFAGDELSREKSEQEKIIEDHRIAENQIFLVAEIGNEIVALLNVHTRPRERLKHVGEFGISVLKAHWGKGIASILLKTMINWAKENKIIKKLNLEVLSHNESAIKLYKKHGFEMEGCMRRDFYIKGQYYDAYFMGMLID